MILGPGGAGKEYYRLIWVVTVKVANTYIFRQGLPASVDHEALDQGCNTLTRMVGSFKFAVHIMVDATLEVLRRAGLNLNQVDYLPHTRPTSALLMLRLKGFGFLRNAFNQP